MRIFRLALTLVVLMTAMGTMESFAQLSATSYVTNFAVANGFYSFDVYAQRTGATAIRVGTSNFIVNTNRAGLSPIGMTITNVNPKFTAPGTTNGDYDVMRVDTIVGGGFSGKVAVTVRFTGLGDNGTGQLLDNSTPNGERICTINMPIINGALTAQLTWDIVNSAITDSRSLPVTNTFTGSDNSQLPVQLSSFTGTVVNGSQVRLNWTTISEVNNYGFHVERKRASETSFTDVPGSFIAGHGTTNERHDYTFTDRSPNASSLSYRLRQADLDGTIHVTEPIHVTGVTSVGGEEVAPREFALKQNYPNPFNPETSIKFSVEQTGRATLDIYTMLGQKVATLFDDVVEAGFYQTVKLDATNLASAMYLYRLQSGQKSDLKKLLLLK